MGDLALAMTPLAFLGLCVAATPLVVALGTVAATVWFERIYMPRLNFEQPTKPIDYRGWPQ